MDEEGKEGRMKTFRNDHRSASRPGLAATTPASRAREERFGPRGAVAPAASPAGAGLALRLAAVLLSCFFGPNLQAAQADTADPARDREMRERYEAVLLKNPFQDRAFNQVYDSYSKIEGVDKWIEALKPKADGPDGLAVQVLLGQVYDRQFKTADAIAVLDKAGANGESRPQFKVLLGTLYYKAGQDDKAAGLLGAALDSLTDLDQRSAVCRMLGNLYLRQGKRDEAVAVWKRVAEQNPGETFAQLELAEIYEDNRMWTNAIAVYRAIADNAKDDPYRRCRALRSIGQAMVQSERFKDAISTYEQALELVAPGNWLFEDLKLRLVGVYEDIGDLAGLVKYLNAKLEQNPADLEFRDLLAETYARMAKFDEAEKQYKLILERNPRGSATYEKLIGLYTRTAKKAELAATYEKLIELFPTDTDYLRRFGESYLRDNNPEKAKETWRRLTKDASTAEKLAQLAGWFESYDFPDEAIATYQQALEKGKNKEWTLHLAGLKFQKGEEAEAVKLWLGVIDPATSKLEDYAEVASILESNNKVDEAAKLRKVAVEKDAKNLDARLALAKVLMRQQKFDEAAMEYDALAGQSENEFLMQQGEAGQLEAWRELGILAEKQKAWEKELEANAQNPKLIGRLARLYERIGQREKAIQLYEHRRATEPDNIEHLRSLATLYASAKQTEQAIATLNTLLEKDKNRARVYQKELLDIYLGVDLKDEAIAAAKEIVSLAPSDPEARLQLAQVYQTYREPEKALAEYRYALRLEPNEPDYYRQYGEALEGEKRYGDAQEAYRKMLDVSKEDSTRLSAVANLARIYQQQERLDELVSEFTRRIRNTPKKLAAYEEMAAINKESGQIFKSVEVLESGLQNVDDKAAALKALIRTGFEAQDFAKVKNYYEQLVAMSGKPSAMELEKLGQIYAQMGDVEKARATWNRILADAPKDAKAADRLAGLLRGQGFTDEALVVKAKAVELDPNDYKRRFEYAQLLQQTDQPIEAMKQVTLILEIGDREQAKKEEKEKEKKVQALNRGQQGSGAISPYQFVYGSRSYGGRYYGAGWQGTYKQFRPQLLQYLATIAQQSIGQDAYLEQFKERIKKRPDDLILQRDYLVTLQMYNQGDEALKLAQAILEKVPDDVDLLQQTALYYSDQQQMDKAIPLLEKLAKLQPKYRLQAAQGLVPLYFKNKQEDKALELVHQVLGENPTDVNTFFMMGSVLQQNGKYDEAKKVYEKIVEMDPKMKSNVRMSLAALAKSSGKQAEALALYRDILLGEQPNQQGIFNPRRRANIYSPAAPSQNQNQNRIYYGNNPMQNLPQNAIAYLGYEKVQAFQELKQNAKTDAGATNDIVKQLEEVARSYSSRALPAARDRAWEATRLLVAHYLTEKEPDKARDLLEAVRKVGFEETDWYNAALYVAEQREDYDGMQKLYDAVQQREPSKARDIAVAKTMTCIIAKQPEAAAKDIRELNQQRVPPGMVLSLIQGLQGIGEKQLAKQLLEEHLSGASRNSDALATLANLYADENDYDRAIALANEAWERKAHGRQGGGGYYYSGSYYYYSGMPSGGQIDNVLRQLQRYYVAAGKSDELLKRFQERLEKQPGSMQAYENLAELYRMGNNRDKALELYQSLAEKRPHLLQVKRTIATLYTEMGDFKKATDYYEQLAKANPQAMQSFQWELRYMYQRMGKGKELQKMEEKMVEKARDPSQMWNLAQQLHQSGEIDKALELFAKAEKLQPNQPWLKSQMGAILIEVGKLDEAVKLYEQWLDSPATRANNYVDYNALKQLAGLYRATGKLNDLKAHCEADLKKNSADAMAKGLQTQIALLEKRFDDALAAFKAAVELRPDSFVISELVSLAEISGKVDEVLAIADKASDSQNGSWELQSIARLYFAKGDKQKGEVTLVKWAEMQISQGNASWALRETLQQLSQFECWEAAEKFVRKHRSDPMQQYESREFDQQIATAYIQNQRFSSVIEEVLQKGSFKGRDLDLLKQIAQQYQQNDAAKRRPFLEKVCAADPKNKELAFQLANLYTSDEDTPKKLAILKRLSDEEPNSAQYRESYTTALIANGQAEEALKSLADWAAARPVEARYTLLAKQQRRASRFAEARASYLKGAEVADPSRKLEAQLTLAEFDAERGDCGPQEKAMGEFFAKRKDANAFTRYLRFLQTDGFPDKAYEFFLANREKGFLEQYSANEYVTLCLDHSDYQTPMDVSWQFARYGERWNRDYYLDQVVKYYQDRGKLGLFLEDFQKRVDTEAPKHRGMLQKLAAMYSMGGYPEKAIATYDRLLALSPFNREFRQAKIDLLINLDRGDEALAILRDGKDIMNLNDELQAQYSLIRALYKLKRNTEAEKEIAGVLAWAKGGGTLDSLAGIQFEQKQYEPAAVLYEKARPLRRGEEGNQLLMNLGVCYAKSKRLDDALKVWSDLISAPDQTEALNRFQDTLQAEGMNGAVLKLIEARIARAPTNLVLYVFLAGALHDGSQDAAALDVFARAEKAIDKEKLTDLRNRMGDFLKARKLIEPAFQRYEANPTPLMAGALVRALNGAGQKEKALAEKAAKFTIDDSQQQIALADTLAKLKCESDAAAWYRKALGSTNSAQRIAAAKGLALTGAGAEATGPLLELLKNRPQEFINDTNLLVAIAKTKNEGAIAEFLKVRSAWALNESETNYYRAVLLYYSGRTNEAKPVLTALADGSGLTSVQLHMLSALCHEMDLPAENAKFERRFLAGGHRMNFYWAALDDLASQYSKRGEWKEAVTALAAMLPVWNQRPGQQARDSVAKAVTAQNFPGFKTAVVEAARAGADKDQTSNLLGFCAQLGQKLGLDEHAGPLAEDGKASTLERSESAAWDQLVKQWEVCGPFRGRDIEAVFSPEEDFAGESASATRSTVTWTPTDPKSVLGIVRVDKILDAKETAGSTVYARGIINSPDSRTATFFIGSAGPVKIWVNDKLALTSTAQRDCGPDQNRFTATLHKGANPVLVKLANGSGNWNFCFRIAEGGDGLVMARR